MIAVEVEVEVEVDSCTAEELLTSEVEADAVPLSADDVRPPQEAKPKMAAMAMIGSDFFFIGPSQVPTVMMAY